MRTIGHKYFYMDSRPQFWWAGHLVNKATGKYTIAIEMLNKCSIKWCRPMVEMAAGRSPVLAPAAGVSDGSCEM